MEDLTSMPTKGSKGGTTWSNNRHIDEDGNFSSALIDNL